MSQGKRGRRLKVQRSDANFQSSEQDRRGEYGRSGRYQPGGQQNSPGVKSGKPFRRTAVRLRPA